MWSLDEVFSFKRNEEAKKAKQWKDMVKMMRTGEHAGHNQIYNVDASKSEEWKSQKDCRNCFINSAW